MPPQTPTQTVLPPLLANPNPFLDYLLRYLIPYFTLMTEEDEAARAAIPQALASYGARTQSELIQAARIIAFSFSALDLLAEAKVSEMSPAMCLRFRSCANNINRSCQQDEQKLLKRLTCDNGVQPEDNMPEPDFEAALQHAEAEIASYRNRLSGDRPATSPQPQQQPRSASRRLETDMIANAMADMRREPPAITTR